jgi:alkanesulfonate monooxygenase SsuD/methylene tetrahydromethanopterin reductase-like flavin-dependent oxidoreductase (luciferase family)
MRYLDRMRVGITIPVAESEAYQPKRYTELRQLARAAEDARLDSIWTADHLLYQPDPDTRPRGFWESWTLLAALAEATERVELGHLVACLPFRNPGLTAYMANTLDEISGGRFVLGVGSGWHEPEFSAFGFEFRRRVSYFADTLAIVAPLLRDRTVDYDGALAGAHAELRPRGPRPAGPPILIASVGPRMLELTAQWADRWVSAWHGPPAEEFWKERRDLVDACRRFGRDVAEIEIVVGVDIIDQPTPDELADGALLTGTAEELADPLHAWQAEGIAEVICRLDPPTPAMAERVARAVEIMRARAADR